LIDANIGDGTRVARALFSTDYIPNSRLAITFGVTPIGGQMKYVAGLITLFNRTNLQADVASEYQRFRFKGVGVRIEKSVSDPLDQCDVGKAFANECSFKRGAIHDNSCLRWRNGVVSEALSIATHEVEKFCGHVFATARSAMRGQHLDFCHDTSAGL
jgi:hypothetical protein